MLTYGQSVDPKNPHYGDQIPLYSRKEFPQLPFTPEKIRADPAYQLTRLRE
ncbi:penicillin acylase family protein [Massilia sp. B-10]|nr:penicillin acylase family protein [Massilia sp. B-10]